MKDILTSLWQHLLATTKQTRLVIGAGALLLVAVAGVMSYRAANPHMVPAFTGLDNMQFSAVTSALAGAGIRFDTTSPPGPLSVFVPASELYQARNAVATNSALDMGPKGIGIGEGAASIFDSSDKRLQQNQKRDWQDLELQIEALNFILAAVVRTSGPPPSPLLHSRPHTVSVVVHVLGSVSLEPGQRRALASIVRHGTNVPEENITITDQHGHLVFDGKADQGMSEYLSFEKEWADLWTARAQAKLDGMFGPGMTTVDVLGEFDFALQESVSENIDPTKVKLRETVSESSTPMEASVGGPAGLQTSLQNTSAPAPVAAKPSEATESETTAQYTYGHTTTHTQQGAPLLKRMTVSLALHDSLEASATKASELVKRLVRFDESRDDFYNAILPLASVTVDEDGKPVLPTAEPAPAPPSKLLGVLLERGIELLAAGAFLFVLLKSLRKGAAKETKIDPKAALAAAAAQVPEEDLDLDMLARKHVEQMLEEDPEKVAALLSRWALGEDFYAGAKS